MQLYTFVDIHSHIIPGIDDGAKDMETALEMLRLASLDGTRHIVATPHFTPSTISDIGGATLDTSGIMNISEIVREKTSELSEQAASLNIDINIYSGTEVLIHPDIPSLLENNSICTINGSKYVLVEFPMSEIPLYASEVLYQIQLKGLIPIIAHPERYNEVIKDCGILLDLVGRGMLVQVNAGSLTGLFGRKAQKTAMKLIKAGMTHFVASDAHGCGSRSPELGKAAWIVEKKFGREIMQELFYSNGMAVIENRASF